MFSYYVHRSAKPSGDHEVHREGCRLLPGPPSRIDLGRFTSCHDAVRVAQEHYTRVNGCFYCANVCHENSQPRRPAPHRRSLPKSGDAD